MKTQSQYTMFFILVFVFGAVAGYVYGKRAGASVEDINFGLPGISRQALSHFSSGEAVKDVTAYIMLSGTLSQLSESQVVVKGLDGKELKALVVQGTDYTEGPDATGAVTQIAAGDLRIGDRVVVTVRLHDVAGVALSVTRPLKEINGTN